MGIDCGSQVILCDYPIRYDTYSGCSHGCKYCFVTKNGKGDLKKIKGTDCTKQLRGFIEGKRTSCTNWCDWPIPLHWGGMSDPFQPIERRLGVSLKSLEVLAETGYPVIISTKGRLISEEPYLGLLGHCNAVMQVSMTSPKLDRIEPGCPTFEERMAMLSKLAPNCKRLIVRCQPYMTNCLGDVLKAIPRYKAAGVHGVIVEGFKAAKGFSGSVKKGADFCYPDDVLRQHFERIREACHDSGLSFLCGENSLRQMGDSLMCCGCEGLEGFDGNTHHALRASIGEASEPTDRMRGGGREAVSVRFSKGATWAGRSGRCRLPTLWLAATWRRSSPERKLPCTPRPRRLSSRGGSREPESRRRK